jgi:type II secretory pathway component PulF
VVQAGGNAWSAVLPIVFNLLGMVGAGVVLYLGYRAVGGGSLDKIMIHIPWVGGVMRQLALARFTRTLAIGQKAGVPLLQALDTAIDVSGNAWLQDQLKSLPGIVGKGKRIGDAMAGFNCLPSTLTEMIRTGEESGRLPEMLEKTAGFFEQEAATRIQRFNSIFPVLVFLAVAAYAVFYIILPTGRAIFTLPDLR